MYTKKENPYLNYIRKMISENVQYLISPSALSLGYLYLTSGQSLGKVVLVHSMPVGRDGQKKKKSLEYNVYMGGLKNGLSVR